MTIRRLLYHIVSDVEDAGFEASMSTSL